MSLNKEFTNKQLEKANQKALILKEYENSRLSVKEFLQKHNADNSEFTISRDQFFRWKRKLKENGNVLDLVDRRGGHNKGQSCIPEDTWNSFYALYMDGTKKSVQKCYDIIKSHFKGILLPNISAFKRRLKRV